MAQNTLTAEKRNNSQTPNQLRSNGKVPATVYGKGMESISIEVDNKDFATKYKKDKNAIFKLTIGKEALDSIVKKVQYSNVKQDILHVEFQRIISDEKIKVVVPVELVGTSLAVKGGGSLVHNMSEIEVECLPADIPHGIKVDISKLANLEDTITIGDVEFPAGVKPTHSSDLVVVKVTAASTVETVEETVDTPIEETQETK
ncbi:MAG: 50S ribosomal protein L25 [Candidatus Gastranaerophilales bacterium]|nr:50S ribosomal protein L25 [Candidatus Gastranaerophilales bacterium]